MRVAVHQPSRWIEQIDERGPIRSKVKRGQDTQWDLLVTFAKSTAALFSAQYQANSAYAPRALSGKRPTRQFGRCHEVRGRDSI
jgi:hypothetical protein